MGEKFETYLVLRPIAMGGRVEAGAHVQLTKKEAAVYPPDYLQLVEDQSGDDAGDAGSKTDDSSGTGSAGKQPEVKTEPKLVDHVVTQEDLDKDRRLRRTGVQVGQTIQIPAA